MTQQKPKDLIEDLNYADARHLTTKRRERLHGLAKGLTITFLFGHLGLSCMAAAAVHGVTSNTMIMSIVSSQFGPIKNLLLAFWQRLSPAFITFAVLDFCAFVVLFMPREALWQRVERYFAVPVCAIGILWTLASFCFVWHHWPIRVNAAGRLELNLLSYFFIGILGAGPSILGISYAALKAIRSRRRAPSPEPESSPNS